MASHMKKMNKTKSNKKINGVEKYTISEVKNLGLELISSRAHVNNLPILLSLIKPSSPPQYVIHSLLSLQSFFTPLLPQIPSFSSSLRTCNDDSQKDAEFIYLTWLRSKFDELAQSLIDVVVSESCEVTLREVVLDTMMEFVKVGNGGKFHTVIFHKFIHAIVESTSAVDVLLDLLESKYFKYIDVRYFTCISLEKLGQNLKKMKVSDDKNLTDDRSPKRSSMEFSIRNIHNILSRISLLKGPDETSEYEMWNGSGKKTQAMASSKQTYRVCFCFRRRFRLAASEAPAEIKALFDRYSDNGTMTLPHLHRFLIEVQREDNATLEDAQSVFDQLHELKILNIFHRKGLNLEAFFKYLFNDINPPISPSRGIHQDMDAPLSHYFIFTGHNSYLTGNQLSSDCSDGPIIKALQRGVRVIELDIWPNSTGEDVNVLHGRTLTTPVKLLKCLKSIKDHAFTASEYPVVITLEDHLTQDLQAKVADMVTQTFGDALFTPGSECLKEFPSPQSLKKRFIISTKPPKEYLQAKKVEGDEKDDLQKEKDVADEGAWGKELSIHKYGTTEDKDDLNEDDSPEEEDDDDDKSNQKTAPEYRRLIAIHAGKGKGGLDDWLKVDPEKVRRLSLSEPELEKAVTTHGKAIVRFTQRNILRVYPKGIRFDSSNYNPLIAWTHGAQMVAFNMQGYGRSLWLMHGMFRANGGCGYVKKPDFLLKTGPHNEVFDPETTLPTKTTLKVTIYMGEGWYYDFKHTHFDAYSPPDFYARIGIAGVRADTVMKKTRTLEDNWIPNWNQHFEFPLTVPELALLRIEVHEYDMSEKDDFGGQTCLPVSELRSGIRSIPLHSRKGDKYNSVKVLMRFEFV